MGARVILHHYDRETSARAPSLLETEYGPMLHDAAVFSESPPWGSNEFPAYLIPRGKTILVGGSYLEGDEAKGLRPAERARHGQGRSASQRLSGC